MFSTGGLYAPTIRHHNGVFYIVCTNVIHANVVSGDHINDKTDNFIISTKNIWSNEWSNPIYFEFDGIDPSIFVDTDGKVYIQGSRSPGPKTEIHLFQVDLNTGEKLSRQRKIWGGTGGIYPEGPHLYKKDDFYHLIISEGGTHGGHMITCARSKDIWGPYEGFAGNPILAACKTNEEIQFTGHADLFEGKDGKWWVVCLGVRLDKGRIVMGRETFLTSASWSESGWPRIDQVTIKAVERGVFNGDNALLFTSVPGVDYLYIRDSILSNFVFSTDRKHITLTAAKGDFSQYEEPITFVGKRQRKLRGEATVSVRCLLRDNNSRLQAGLAYYKDEHRYIKLFYDFKTSEMILEVKNQAKEIWKSDKHKLEQREVAYLRIQYTPRSYSLAYKEGNDWISFEPFDTLDLSGLDFVGPVIGAFAIGDEDNSKVVCNDLEIA